jgi:hypothetical protein
VQVTISNGGIVIAQVVHIHYPLTMQREVHLDTYNARRNDRGHGLTTFRYIAPDWCMLIRP